MKLFSTYPQPFTVKENEARCIAIPLHITAIRDLASRFIISTVTAELHATQMKYTTILTYNYLMSLTLHITQLSKTPACV